MVVCKMFHVCWNVIFRVCTWNGTANSYSNNEYFTQRVSCMSTALDLFNNIVA